MVVELAASWLSVDVVDMLSLLLHYGHCILSSSTSQSSGAFPEPCMCEISCRWCVYHCYLPCNECNRTWQLSSYGWYKSRRGNLCCPVCASAYDREPMQTYQQFSKHLCSGCMDLSGQFLWRTIQARKGLGGSSSSGWRYESF